MTSPLSRLVGFGWLLSEVALLGCVPTSATSKSKYLGSLSVPPWEVSMLSVEIPLEEKCIGSCVDIRKHFITYLQANKLHVNPLHSRADMKVTIVCNTYSSERGVCYSIKGDVRDVRFQPYKSGVSILSLQYFNDKQELPVSHFARDMYKNFLTEARQIFYEQQKHIEQHASNLKNRKENNEQNEQEDAIEHIKNQCRMQEITEKSICLLECADKSGCVSCEAQAEISCEDEVLLGDATKQLCVEKVVVEEMKKIGISAANCLDVCSGEKFVASCVEKSPKSVFKKMEQPDVFKSRADELGRAAQDLK